MKDKIYKGITARKHRIINSILVALLFSILPLGFEYLYIKALPTSYWFHYEKIEPAMPAFAAGSYPRFVSFGEIKRPSNIRWTDVMRCDDGNGEYFYRSYESSAYLETPRTFPRVEIDPKTGTEITTSWEYGHRVPNMEGTECFLESSVKVELPFGITKVQQITSSKFTIE